MLCSIQFNSIQLNGKRKTFKEMKESGQKNRRTMP